MEVILRDHVDYVGKRGDLVKVADGYARPSAGNLALPATEANKNRIARGAEDRRRSAAPPRSPSAWSHRSSRSAAEGRRQRHPQRRR